MRILLLNQAFHPDVVSTAQHASDLALDLADRGHEVTVVCGSRGYDDPSLEFPRRESWRGIRIERVPCLGLGKKSKVRRALTFGSFMTACLARSIRLGRFDVVVAMTSPPLIAVLGAVVAGVRKAALVSWIMDLNPDEAVAAGWLKDSSLVTATLRFLLGHSLRTSRAVVVLDRFMRDRVVAKGVPEDQIEVVPPWSHDQVVRYDVRARERFRAQHGMEGKFVVQYSGNHSPCHPLDTLLAAAERFRGRTDVVFCFAGGGSEYAKVRRFAAESELKNIILLPYQPLQELSASLSAADLHVVVMGEKFVGIVHPCKIYNILTVARPVLYIGPAPSHITDVLPPHWIGERAYAAVHGDVDAVAAHIAEAAAKAPVDSPEEEIASRFSERVLVPRMTQVIEAAGMPRVRQAGMPGRLPRPSL